MHSSHALPVALTPTSALGRAPPVLAVPESTTAARYLFVFLLLLAQHAWPPCSPLAVHGLAAATSGCRCSRAHLHHLARHPPVPAAPGLRLPLPLRASLAPPYFPARHLLLTASRRAEVALTPRA